MAGVHPGGGSGASASSLGLPSTAPSTARGLTFATINAETLEAAARDADFPVPGQDVIDQVTQQYTGSCCMTGEMTNHMTNQYVNA